MPWDEAVRLARFLRGDPGSAIAASCEGWEHPMSRLEAEIADLWELEYAKSGSRKPARYPRPYRAAKDTVRHGNAAGRTPDEVKAILAKHAGRTPAPI